MDFDNGMRPQWETSTEKNCVKVRLVVRPGITLTLTQIRCAIETLRLVLFGCFKFAKRVNDIAPQVVISYSFSKQDRMVWLFQKFTYRSFWSVEYILHRYLLIPEEKLGQFYSPVGVGILRCREICFSSSLDNLRFDRILLKNSGLSWRRQLVIV